MSTVERRRSSTSTNEITDLHGSYSVEELFQKYSIANIQTLNSQYKTDAENAKSDLQKLVSDKYRDLISITDQINDTYEAARQFNSHLAEFSFKSANFVKFSSPEFCSFQKRLNSTTVSEITQTETVRIVNDVIYEKLLYLETLLHKNNYKTSAFLHTSNYIYFAKLYFVLQTNYHKEIKSNKLTDDIFQKLKNNFLKFLTYQISTYSLSNRLFTESDRSSFLQTFDLDQVISQNPLVSMEMNDEYEVLSESKDSDTLLELNFELPEKYDQDTSSIINYLVCFTLLKSKDISISRSTILFEFLTIKYNYLKSVLDQVLVDSSNYNKVNFYNILKYIENTFDYISEYFENSDVKNPLIKALSHSTKRWNIINDPFVDLSSLKFNIDPVLINLPPSSVKDLKEFKIKFVSIFSEFFKKLAVSLTDHLDQLGQNLFLFKLLLVSLKKIELSCNNMGSKSQIIKLVSDDDLLFDILKSISANCNQLYQTHLEDFSKLIELASNPEKPSELSLFTTNFVDLVDNNLSDYYSYMLLASSNSTLSFDDDLIKKIYSWFQRNSELLLLLEMSETAENKYFNLYEVTNFLSTENEVNWGKFNKKKLIDEFTSLKSELINRYWKVYKVFYQGFAKITEDNLSECNLSGIYFSIKILNSLKLCLNGSGLDEETVEQQTKELDTLTLTNYEKIFEIVSTRPYPSSSGSFADQFESIITSAFSNETVTEDLILRLLVKLSTTLFKFSSSLLNPESEEYQVDYKQGVVFASSNELFKTCKDKWIKQHLIDKIYTIMELGDSATTKAIITQAYLLFIKHFITENPDITDEEAKKISTIELDNTEMTKVTEMVKEIYEASENTYYPLNA